MALFSPLFALLVGVLWCGSCSVEGQAAQRQSDTPVSANSTERLGRKHPGTSFFESQVIVDLDLAFEPAEMANLARTPTHYVPATLVHDGRTYRVAIRFKGNRSMRRWAGKPAFKIHFGKYDKRQRFFGLKRLVLNNMVEDQTMMREALAYRVFRAVGVPAPRTRYALVTVNGEPFGLYLAIEPIDKALISDRLGDDTGPLYEGEFGCDVYPDDAWSMELDAGQDPDRALLRGLARSVAGPAARLFADEESPFDRERVLAYLAASALLGDFDGYAHAHNYFLYFVPSRQKWLFLPWGLDRTLRDRVGIYHSNGLVAVQCFGDADCRREYVRTLGRVVDQFLALDPQRELDRLAALIHEASRSEPRRQQSDSEIRRERSALRRFLAERPAEIGDQIACLGPARSGALPGSQEVDTRADIDRDRDGHSCGDCDDTDPRIHPDMQEFCDGIDNNCSGVIDDHPDCGCPAVTIDDGLFFLCDLDLSWAEAAEFCAAQGNVLARIDSADISRRLYRAAAAQRMNEWWIGLNDRGREGRFGWHSRVDEKRDRQPQLGRRIKLRRSEPAFTNWADGEPDNHVCGQDCAAFKEGGNGLWRDAHCAARNPFICMDAGTLE